MAYQRARSDEQREERRQLILDTAATMLGEMPVSDVSLNELSRRVGLAKSAMLRYFESREAVLLELLDNGLSEWIEAVRRVAILPGTVRKRSDCLAAAFAHELAARHMLCDLIGAQASVLERNVSTEVVLRHKRANLLAVAGATEVIKAHLPELTVGEAGKVFAYLLLMTSAAWPRSRPTLALAAAYSADPEIAALHMDFESAVQETVAVVISGVLARK